MMLKFGVFSRPLHGFPIRLKLLPLGCRELVFGCYRCCWGGWLFLCKTVCILVGFFWQLLDLIKEIQEILHRPQLEFLSYPLEVNNVSDQLATGSHSSAFLYDVWCFCLVSLWIIILFQFKKSGPHFEPKSMWSRKSCHLHWQLKSTWSRSGFPCRAILSM